MTPPRFTAPSPEPTAQDDRAVAAIASDYPRIATLLERLRAADQPGDVRADSALDSYLADAVVTEAVVPDIAPHGQIVDIVAPGRASVRQSTPETLAIAGADAIPARIVSEDPSPSRLGPVPRPATIEPTPPVEDSLLPMRQGTAPAAVTAGFSDMQLHIPATDAFDVATAGLAQLGMRDLAREALRARLVAFGENRQHRSAYEIVFIMLAFAVMVLVAAPPLVDIFLAVHGTRP